MSQPLLTAAQIADIGRRYDGTRETIDQLVKEYGVRRHNIHSAARRCGYKSKRPPRITWTAEKDQYLRDNWGKLPPAEIYAHMGCENSTTAVFNRLKRIGHSTRNNEDLTIYDLEHLTKLDHRLWRRFIDDGWLRSYDEYGRDGQVWSRRVKVEWIGAFLRSHPDAINYRAADKYARAVLELDKLPDPPKYALLTCHADNWKDGVKPSPAGCKVHHGNIELVDREHKFSLESCASIGGTDVWTPMYQGTSCPRCGCLVSRFSDKAIFSDTEPDDGNVLNAIAGKLGLTWRDGRFHDAAGIPVSEEELLRYVFSTRRQPGKAFATFRRLLEAGMSVAPPNPVPADQLLPNALRYELREGQLPVFGEFLNSGNVGVYWPPGIGKMYFLGMVYASLAGEHLLFVHTRTIRDQWIEFFKAQGTVNVAYVKTPHHYRIDIFDQAGSLRSVVRIFSYATRVSFDDSTPVVVGFDESQFLPGNNASRLSMIKSQYRVGLSATPFREDKRADMIQLMTGRALGQDWQEFKDSGQIADVPVRVMVVTDLEQKHRALRRCLKGCKTIVFSDGIDDGKRISAELHIPFIHGETTKRLQVLSEHQAVVMSRVGDCGIDTTDLEEVIEFSFHHGSRSQSLQRMGRLLHSTKPLQHTVLMTVKEFSLYHKRLSALEQKGFPIRIQMFKDHVQRGRPPAPKPISEWCQLLGVTPARRTTPPMESNADKRARVMRRLTERGVATMEATA
ncbi:MAG: hypothetical protein WAO76_07345 [Georgfuchsia sp.]